MEWTNKKTEYLKKNYSKMHRNKIAKKLGISANAVRIKAKRLGLKSYKSPRRFIWKRGSLWYIHKTINNKRIGFGSFRKLEHAMSERDILEQCDWDFDVYVEAEISEMSKE